MDTVDLVVLDINLCSLFTLAIVCKTPSLSPALCLLYFHKQFNLVMCAHAPVCLSL